MCNEKNESVTVQRLESVPSGLKHVMMIDEFGEKNRLLSVPMLGEHKDRFHSSRNFSFCHISSSYLPSKMFWWRPRCGEYLW